MKAGKDRDDVLGLPSLMTQASEAPWRPPGSLAERTAAQWRPGGHCSRKKVTSAKERECAVGISGRNGPVLFSCH